jgi:hypothetical protein
MPTGIILSSGSQGATPEAIEKVLQDNGYEPDKPEVTETPAEEPKREDFKSDDEFAEAQQEFEAKQEELAEKEAEEEERKEAEREAARPKPSRRQRAIDKATKDLREQNKKLEERIAAIEGKKPATAQPEVKEPEKPKREAFKTDEEFEESMFEWRYKTRRAKEEQEAAQRSLETQLQENFASYQTAVADFKETHDDWDEVVTDSVSIPQSVYYAIVELGADGPRVSYYLGQHPEYADKLAELTPYRAAMEVGRLADKLKGGQKPEAERTTPRTRPRIPEPVRPVSTSATSSTLTSAEAAKKRNYKAFKVAQHMGR